MDPITMTLLGVGLAPLLKGLFGGGNSQNQSTQDYSRLLQNIPELRRMLDLQTQEAERRAPLQKAMTDLATRLLPRSAFGGNVPTVGASGSGVPTSPWPHGAVRDLPSDRNDWGQSRIMEPEPGPFPGREQGYSDSMFNRGR